MTVTYIYAVPGDTYALVRGPGVGGWFRSHRIPAMRTAMHNGYWLRQERVSDVVLLMEMTGVVVTLAAHEAPRYIPPALNEEAA